MAGKPPTPTEQPHRQINVHVPTMGEDFDPYFKWLGIPPEQQPPNHYQLLGVPVFTDDPDVISHAVDRLMAHLRTFQSGPKSAHSQKLLNEISGARVCLLNAEKKAEYDHQLRLEMDAQQQPADISAEVPGSSPTPPSLSPETSMAMDALPTTSQIRRTGSPTVASTRYRRQRRKKKILPVVFVLVLMVAASLLGIALFKAISNSSDPDPVFGGPTSEAKQQPDDSSKTAAPEDSRSPDEKSVANEKPAPEVALPARPPTIEAIGGQDIALGHSLSVKVIARDASGEVLGLNYELVSGPPDATINPVNGHFSWTPTAEDRGQTHTAVVRVKDLEGQMAKRSFTIRVGREVRLPADPALHLSFDRSTIFEEGQQQYFRDTSGHQHHAANHGAILEDGLIGEAVAYGANKSYLQIASHSSLQGGPAATLSVSAWWRYDDPETEGPLITKFWDSEEKDWSLFTRKRALTFFSANLDGFQRMGGAITPGWHHVAFVLDQPQSRLQLYLDGELVVAEDLPREISAATEGDIFLGAMAVKNQDLRGFTRGVVDQLRIYNRALSPDEIRTSYIWDRLHQGAAATPPDDSAPPGDKPFVDKPSDDNPFVNKPSDDNPFVDKRPDDTRPDDRPPAKLPVPPESEIALVREKLQSRIADKSALKLLQMAAERTTTDARRYVLLMTARDRAAQAGEYKTARDALQALDRAFQVDLPALQHQNIAAVLVVDSSATAWSEVCRDALRASREAQQRGDVELAKRVATYALSAARKSGDKELSSEATKYYFSLE